MVLVEIFHSCFSSPKIMDESVLTTLKKSAFENNVGKGEDAGKQHFLSSSLYFYHFRHRSPSSKLAFFNQLSRQCSQFRVLFEQVNKGHICVRNILMVTIFCLILIHRYADKNSLAGQWGRKPTLEGLT